MRQHRVLASLIAILCLAPAGCATLPTDFERVESYAYAPAAGLVWGENFKRELDAHPGQSGYDLLDNGLDAFVARAVLANRASRSIDAQYYLFHNDLTGRLFVDQGFDPASLTDVRQEPE